MDIPTRLRVEHLGEALGLTVSRPRLSWLLPREAVVQRAYRLQVGSWDSGRVVSEESVLVPYTGPGLTSRQVLPWRVKVWTDLGESGWSHFGSFEMGLLHSSDWTAQWIQPTEPDVLPPGGMRPAFLLRHEFQLEQEVRQARAYATALGVYELFINGVRVGDHELSPGFTSYRSNVHVQTYDVTHLLTPGANVVGAELSDGWYRGVNGMFRDVDAFGDRTALLAQLHVSLADGTERVVASDGDWRSAPGALITADLMAGVSADLRRRPPGWSTGGFDPVDWDPVIVADHGYSRLLASPAPPVRRVEHRRPLSISTAPSGRQVVDLGENITGWARLDRLGPAGQETVLTFAEALDPAGEVSQKNMVPEHLPPGLVAEAGQVDRVISAGRPGEVFEPRHTTHGFRYIQVEGADHPLEPADITGISVNSDLQPIGSFRCSDGRLNQLHDVAVRSFLGNVCDIPTDCPTRERSGWTGDWQIFVQAAAFLYDVAGFSDKWLRDLAADQWPDGIVPNYIPDPLGPGTKDHPLLGRSQGSAGWGTPR